ARFVSNFDAARIDLARYPMFMVRASFEALTEAADVSGWVAEDKPENLCVGIGEGTFGSLPDYVSYFRSFIHDQENSLALIVKASEGGRVFLRPRDHVDAPCALTIWVFGEEGGGGESEAGAGKPAEVEPLTEFRPSFGFQLGFSIG